MVVGEVFVAMGVLSPFPFYWFLWNYPTLWMQWCGAKADPCQVMAMVSHGFKVVQFGALLSVSTFSWPLPSFFFYLCLPAILVGQFLNFRVYKLLGEDGVYYGVRFGKKIPWVTEFPYGYMRDPQYVGSILTLLGCLCWVPWKYVLLWSLGYFFMVFVENHEDPSTRGKPLAV